MTIMKASSNETKQLTANLPTLISMICNLMTCYALYPCEDVAKKINYHMNALLQSSALMDLGVWRPTFIQLQIQWDTIMQRYQHPCDFDPKPKP